MSTQVTAELRGTTFKGEVTDMDVIFAAGLMMPNYGDVIEKETGLFESFQKFSAEHSAMVAIAGEAGKEAVMQKMSESWAERVILRLNTNLAMRSAFAQRMREIFPTLPVNLISHKRWNDKEGNIHEESSVRLDMSEVMNLLAPIMATLNEVSMAATPEPVVQDDIASLKAELAEMRKSLERPKKSQGFAKQVEATLES